MEEFITFGEPLDEEEEFVLLAEALDEFYKGTAWLTNAPPLTEEEVNIIKQALSKESFIGGLSDDDRKLLQRLREIAQKVGIKLL